MQISVIVTVLNEGASIRRLLDSLLSQTRPADEIVIVDGGSSDDTLAQIARYKERLPLEIISTPGANISAGRNIAIDAASGPVIASTDAGVRLDPNWLAALAAPFETTAAGRTQPQVVAGFFLPDPQTTFEVAMGATVLPLLADIDPRTFLPSSRSIAFTKAIWTEVGGYPTWLDFCEDLIFDFRLRDASGPFAFAPDAIAYFQPRSSLRAFFKQYYQYARGDGKADLWRKRHAIRYLTYLLGLPALLLLSKRHSPWWLLLTAALGYQGLLSTPYRRLQQTWEPLPLHEKVRAAAWVPVIRLTGDLAKMVGYPVGLHWRRQHLPKQPELRWR